ncbi:histidinol-phosphatase [Mycoplasmatota bacterium zrk1]
MKTNYHSHIALCRHAEGTSEEHINKAIEHNFDIFGISDHAPLIKIGNIPSDRTFLHRMKLNELDDYISELQECKSKYKDKIQVLIGLETEYFESHHEYIKRLSNKVDYLIFGNHDFIYDGKTISSFSIKREHHVLEYAKNTIKAFKTGFYKFMSHPDLFLLGGEWNEVSERVAHIIAKASIEYDVPLELNANGIRRGTIKTPQGLRYHYPRKEFWDIVKTYNCKVIVNSDAHHFTEHNDAEFHEAHRLAAEWGLNTITVL